MAGITGLWIPLEYLRNDLLTGNERLIVSYVKFRENDGTFKGNNMDICQALNMRKSRVSEGMSELLRKGFLERDGKEIKISEKFRKVELLESSEKWNSSEKRNSSKIPKSGTISSENRNFPEGHTIYEILKHKNNNDNDVEKKVEVLKKIEKKASKSSSKKTSLPEIEFLNSEFSDFDVFEAYVKQAHPEIDTNFYYYKISSWIDKNTGVLAKRKIWKSTVNQFLENDYKKGDLVTSKSKSHGKQPNNYPKQANLFEQQATPEQLDDLVSQYFANR